MLNAAPSTSKGLKLTTRYKVGPRSMTVESLTTKALYRASLTQYSSTRTPRSNYEVFDLCSPRYQRRPECWVCSSRYVFIPLLAVFELNFQCKVSTKADTVDLESIGRAYARNEANAVDMDSIGRAYKRSSADAVDLESVGRAYKRGSAEDVDMESIGRVYRRGSAEDVELDAVGRAY